MKWLRTVGATLLVAFVTFSLVAAGNDLYGEWGGQCDDPGEIGLCPDFGDDDAEDAACNCACADLFSTGGSCDVGDNCCLCQIP